MATAAEDLRPGVTGAEQGLECHSRVFGLILKLMQILRLRISKGCVNCKMRSRAAGLAVHGGAGRGASSRQGW